MKNLSDMEKQLKNGPHGKNLMDAANSAEAQRLAKTLDKDAIEAAVRSGDSVKLKNIISQILSTPDGKALAQKLGQTMKEK